MTDNDDAADRPREDRPLILHADHLTLRYLRNIDSKLDRMRCDWWAANLSDEARDGLQHIRWVLRTWYENDEIDEWLQTPERLLGDRRPCELIEVGNTEEIERLLASDEWLDAV